MVKRILIGAPLVFANAFQQAWNAKHYSSFNVTLFRLRTSPPATFSVSHKLFATIWMVVSLCFQFRVPLFILEKKWGKREMWHERTECPKPIKSEWMNRILPKPNALCAIQCYVATTDNSLVCNVRKIQCLIWQSKHNLLNVWNLISFSISLDKLGVMWRFNCFTRCFSGFFHPLFRCVRVCVCFCRSSYHPVNLIAHTILYLRSINRIPHANARIHIKQSTNVCCGAEIERERMMVIHVLLNSILTMKITRIRHATSKRIKLKQRITVIVLALSSTICSVIVCVLRLWMVWEMSMTVRTRAQWQCASVCTIWKCISNSKWRTIQN